MVKKKLPNRVLVIGGASSGKSRWAEKLVKSFGQSKHYVATAQAWDDEMRAKIKAHIEMRGTDWVTHEAPLELPALLPTLPQDAVTLLDCATLWLSNCLLEERDLGAEAKSLLQAVNAVPGPLVIVSNEVGQGVVPEYALGRRFRDAQGKLNQALADQADLVVFVMAGLPLVLKGELP